MRFFFHAFVPLLFDARVPDAPEGDARTVPGRGAKAPVALSDMASDDASREPRPEPGSEASTAAQGEGDSRSVSDATNLLTRRLRVAETTVEALEAALARKEELLGEASERERTLRAALDAARLEPDASTSGPAGSGTSGPGSAGADASAETERAEAAADAWRERALAAESARETAAHAAQRLGDENQALRAILERARDAETAETAETQERDDGDGGKTRASRTLGLELRAAVAEGALAASRARAEEAESALGAWQAHARELTSRLERAERRVHSRLRDSKLGSADAPGGDEDGDEGGEPSSAESNLAATVASLATRLEETERLAARLTSFGVRSGAVNQNANQQRVSREILGDDSLQHDDVIAESSEPATPETRRARAEAAAAQLERSRVALRRRESAAAVGTDGDDRFRVAASADAASSALAKALANARRVAETAEQRGATGAAALERARVLERAAAAKLAQVGAHSHEICS